MSPSILTAGLETFSEQHLTAHSQLLRDDLEAATCPPTATLTPSYRRTW